MQKDAEGRVPASVIRLFSESNLTDSRKPNPQQPGQARETIKKAAILVA
jgi:hypothetical protein